MKIPTTGALSTTTLNTQLGFASDANISYLDGGVVAIAERNAGQSVSQDDMRGKDTPLYIELTGSDATFYTSSVIRPSFYVIQDYLVFDKIDNLTATGGFIWHQIEFGISGSQLSVRLYGLDGTTHSAILSISGSQVALDAPTRSYMIAKKKFYMKMSYILPGDIQASYPMRGKYSHYWSYHSYSIKMQPLAYSFYTRQDNMGKMPRNQYGMAGAYLMCSDGKARSVAFFENYDVDIQNGKLSFRKGGNMSVFGFTSYGGISDPAFMPEFVKLTLFHTDGGTTVFNKIKRTYDGANKVCYHILQEFRDKVAANVQLDYTNDPQYIKIKELVEWLYGGLDTSFIPTDQTITREFRLEPDV